MKIVGHMHLPEAVKPLRSVPVRDMTSGALLLEGCSGRVWIVWPELTEMSPTEVVLTNHLTDGYFLSECANGILSVVDNDAETCVFDLASGRPLLKVAQQYQRYDGFCLLPDGRALLCLADDHAAAIRLDDEAPCPVPVVELQLDQPSSAKAVSKPGQPGVFDLVIGCYGYAAAQQLRVTQAFPPVIDRDKKQTLPGALIYDPVNIEAAATAWPWVFLQHGGGAGLCAWNLSNGRLAHCRRSPEIDRPQANGIFRGVLPESHDCVIVRTDAGWIRWRLDEEVQWLCGREFTLLSAAENGVWAIHRDRPAALVKLAL